jgi:predicted RNA-binding Zn-ribbon protein involved in translation (DUF1610 family)
VSETLTEQNPDLSEVSGKPKVAPPATVTGEWCPNCGRNEVVDVAGVGHVCNLCGEHVDTAGAKAAAEALGVPAARAPRKTSSTRKRKTSSTRKRRATAKRSTAKRSPARKRKTAAAAKTTTTKGGR